MATKILRTELVLFLIVVNCAANIKSDSDVNQKYAMPGGAEHLLRGSNDKYNRAEIEDIVKDTEHTEIEKNIDTSTTEAYTTDINAVPGVHNTSDNNEDFGAETKSQDDDAERYETTEHTTEAVTQDTMSVDEEDVYKHSEVDEDATALNNSTSNNIEPTTEARMETTSPATATTLPTPTTTTTTVAPSTTQAMDDMDIMVPRLGEFGDDAGGRRSPKTDNSEPKQPIDKRNFEYEMTKPRPEPKISQSETLKSWLEDPWLRPPAGLLVPLRPVALKRALAVWNDLTEAEGLNITDIVIIGMDSNGINWRSRHNLQGSGSAGNRAVSEALSKLLRKYQGVNTNEATGDATMKALTSAAKLVPYDSALIVITDKAAADPQRLPLALRALVEKRLKVYTVWTDPQFPSAESEHAMETLRNVSRHTEGDVLPYKLQEMQAVAESNNQASEPSKWDLANLPQGRSARLNTLLEDKMETLLVRRGGGDAISLGVPVESGVSSLRIYIEGAVEHAVLYPPNDAPQIDLYNVTSVRAFSPASRTDSLSPRDVFLAFPSSTTGNDMLTVIPASAEGSTEPTAGVWHLSVRCDTCDYRLTVSAHAWIRFETTMPSSDKLTMRILGPVATVRDSMLVDEYGTEISKLAFSYQPAAAETEDSRVGDLNQELVVDVAFPPTKSSKVYAKIVGRDVRGEPFVRLSGPLNRQPEVRMGRSASIAFPDSSNDLELAEEFSRRLYDNRLRYNESNVLPYNRAVSQVVNQGGSLLTTVQIGLSSKLYGAPGDNLQLHFEVSNFREQAVSFRFEAIGELRFLRGISPASQTINAGQTANVIVSVGITASAQPGARDLITFTAYGLEQVSISAYVYVINSDSALTDVWSPTLTHNFQGSCLGRLGDDCVQHAWSASIVARDQVSGILRIASSPTGLLYGSNFIAGSREEVVATYRATCCAPRVMITAVDALGNANSYVLDISNYFTPAGVAAIVLGVFLFIALIALIVFLIYWCVRRRKEETLSSYTSRREV